jgi:enolase
VSPAAAADERVREARLRRVFDSRGNPTVEAEVETESGEVGRAACPSGASTGTHEVRAFPEGGVRTALERFSRRLAPRLPGLPLADQSGFDGLLREVDGSPDLSHLGGNTCTALSVAFADARARAGKVPLWRAISGASGAPKFPALAGNVINGGVHAIGGPEFQEFIAFVDSPDPGKTVEAAVAVHRAVGSRLRDRFPKAALGRGDEGGWVAPLSSVEALELLATCCHEVGDARRSEGVSVRPGLDLAASEFYHKGRYVYRDQTLDPDGQAGFVAKLAEKYDLAYLEDPLEQEDFPGFARLTARLGRSGRIMIVGDDLFCTHAPRVELGIREKAANSVLIKVNQVGTLTDTFRTISLAQGAGWHTVASHRSGEVPDVWLSHVALAAGSRGIKCGVLGGERIAKLNELVRLAPLP